MLSASLGSNHGRNGWSICRACALRLSRPTARNITQRHIQKTVQKELEWKEQEQQIRAGKKQSMLDFLKERGFVKQVTGTEKQLNELMISKRIGVYCGIDPTAPSLHIGHMLPFMITFWMYINGFPAFTLMGGATAKIGDPIGREKPRDQMKRSVRVDNLMHMHDGVKKLWLRAETYATRYGFKNKAEDGNKRWKRGIVQNSAWWTKKTFTEIVSELGSGVRLATMLGRDTVKKRQENGTGMSFAEFAYPMMQSWDFWELYQQLGVQLQVGGSDQYGNLVAGVEAVKHLKENASHAADKVPDKPEFATFGLTTPLLTTPTGKKLGKSDGNAIWLDANMTSPFDLYQHFVRLPDSQVEQYLKWFTLVPTSEIAQVMEMHNAEPAKRTAQHLLAAEFVELVHGYSVAMQARAESREMYPSASEPADLSEVLTMKRKAIVANPPKKEPPEEWARKRASQWSIPQLNKFAPQTNAFSNADRNLKLPRSLVLNRPLPSILYAAGFVKSKQEGMKLMGNGGAYVGGGHGAKTDMGDEIKWTPVKSFYAGDIEPYVIDNILLMRTGKWNIKVVELVDDAVFLAEGLSCPGYSGPVDPPAPGHKPEKVPKQKKDRKDKPPKIVSLRRNFSGFKGLRENSERAASRSRKVDLFEDDPFNSRYMEENSDEEGRPEYEDRPQRSRSEDRSAPPLFPSTKIDNGRRGRW